MQTSAWVSEVLSLAPLEVTHDAVIAAIQAARDEDELTEGSDR